MKAMRFSSAGMFGLLFLLVFALPRGVAAAAYQMPVTFAGYTGRSEALTNFPVLVVLSNNVGGSGFDYANFLSPNGWDLRFKTDLGDVGAGTLNYEFESWNAGGASYIWVRVPVIPGDGSGSIWATWGDEADQNQLPCTTNGVVWADGYRNVYHFGETSGNAADATANRYTATNANITYGAGRIGNSAVVDAEGDNFRIAAVTNEVLTASLWYYYGGVGGDSWNTLLCTFGGTYHHLLINDSTRYVGSWNNGNNPNSSPYALTVGNWYFLTVVMNGTGYKLYRDGGTLLVDAASFNNKDHNLSLISTYNGTAQAATGILDELRIEHVVRSTNWIWACYQSQASNTAFSTFGAARASLTGAPVVDNATGATGLTVNAVFLTAGLISTGSAATVWGICWGTNNPGKTMDPAQWLGQGAGTTNPALPGSLPATNSVLVSGLASGQTYYYRVWATNAVGSNWSSIASFVTLQGASVDNAGGAANVSQTAAKLRGTVLTGVPDPSVYIYWGTADGGTNAGAWDQPVLAFGQRPVGTFSTNLLGLAQGQPYWYRCMASNAVDGAVWAAASSSFTTLAGGVNGTWSADASGNWSDSTKWSGGAIAGGNNCTADFSTLNITADRVVTNDTDGWTIGHLKFGDTYQWSAASSWTLTGPANTLVLSTGGAGTPSIAFGTAYNSGALTIDTILGGTEGVEIKPHPSLTYSRPMIFTKANTYGGVTTVQSNGYLATWNSGTVGASNAVVVKGGGTFSVGFNTLAVNNATAITLESGSLLSIIPQAPAYGPAATLTGPIRIGGNVAIKNYGDGGNQGCWMVLDGGISESTPGSGVTFGALPGGGAPYRGGTRLKRANAYTGPTTLASSLILDLAHADGFGTHAETISVNGTATDYNNVELMLTAAGPGGALNASKALWVGTNAILRQFTGTIVSNTITLAGGTYHGMMDDGAATNAGSIVLSAGTTSVLTKVSWSGSGWSPWIQKGTISGNGAIKLQGYNGHDNLFYFRGSNTYTGGTILQSPATAAWNYIGNDQAFGAGPVELQGTTSNDVMCSLEKSVTMPNVFSGVGRVSTGTYTNTVTGGFAPGSATAPIGTLIIDKLRIGNDSQGVTYYWQYTNGVCDTVAAGTLRFGKTQHTLQCQWLGAGKPATGTNTLFTYTGADPDLTNVTWVVQGLDNRRGAVLPDFPNKRIVVYIRLPPGGTTLLIQ